MPLCVQTHAEAQALYDAGYDEDIMQPSMFGTVWMAPLCRYTWLLVFHCTSRALGISLCEVLQSSARFLASLPPVGDRITTSALKATLKTT